MNSCSNTNIDQVILSGLKVYFFRRCLLYRGVPNDLRHCNHFQFLFHQFSETNERDI